MSGQSSGLRLQGLGCSSLGLSKIFESRVEWSELGVKVAGFQLAAEGLGMGFGVHLSDQGSRGFKAKRHGVRI